MPARLAMVTYSHDAHIWRLRLEPGEEAPNGRLVELPEFAGSLDDPDDLERINLILASWHVYPHSGGWRDQNGGWVVPVLQQR